MPNRFPRPADLLTAAACLLFAAGPADAQTNPVTDAGFDALAADTTFYAEIPMRGVLGVDTPGDGVYEALKSAADNQHVTHAVFMIDAEEGWLLGKDEVGAFGGKLEITAVVRNALAPAIFPVFFADHIYMTDASLIGNLPLHLYLAEGSEEVDAKQIGITSSKLASAAQTRGHPEAVAYAMIDRKKKLYFWRDDDGEPVLSNERPSNAQSLDDYRQIKSVLPSSTLTLDRKTSIEIGLAKPIDAFDPFIVGEYLGKDNWMPANQFGRVAIEISSVIAELEPLREEIRAIDQSFEEIRADRRNNSTEDEGYIQWKKNLDKAVDQIDAINDALAEVMDHHPERHAYFTGRGGRTILADPEAWQADADQAVKAMRQALGMLSRLNDNFDDLSDREFLYDLNQRIQVINERLNGIRKHGNATYWRDHAEPDLPDDIYG